jgi:hypothetical protein
MNAALSVEAEERNSIWGGLRCAQNDDVKHTTAKATEKATTTANDNYNGK